MVVVEHWLLWFYLGGLILRAFLAHGALQNPTVKAVNLDGQVLSCILWPIGILRWVFKSE